MNLVDHEVTGLRAAFDAVVSGARERGIELIDSEIVGLVPASALADGDLTYLKLAGFDPARQVLERLLEAAEEEP